MVQPRVTARIQRNFSLDREFVWALESEANDAGHGNASKVLTEWLEAQAIQRFGIEWRDGVRARRESSEVNAA